MCPKPAITLSRKNWHSTANRAVLWPVPDDEHVPGSCPAGSMAETGRRWWRRHVARTEWRIPMLKSANKQPSKSAAARSAATWPQKTKMTSANDRKEKDGRSTKQALVVEMLRSPTGTTIAAVMKATGWQQHSVRGFFAGVMQKRLRLKLDSRKIDGNRIYRIVDAGGTRSNSRRPSRQSA
jgi:hypothetical protein